MLVFKSHVSTSFFVAKKVYVREMQKFQLELVRMKSTHISKSDLLYGASRLIDDQNDAKVRQVNS